jgi:hypothetical protein
MKRPPAQPCTGQVSERVSPDQESNMDSRLVEEITSRLPTSELVRIIKGALECGRRNVPFTESDLLRAMAFGNSTTHVRATKSKDEPSRPLG